MKKQKKSYHALCPHCGLTLEVYEKFPLRFYIENDTCPHCKSNIIIESNKTCNIMNLIMAFIFVIVMENKFICFGILVFFALYIMLSRKTKQSLIKYKYFKLLKK